VLRDAHQSLLATRMRIDDMLPLRELKQAMPNTPMQMLFRGQNILGYRHYADDVVDKFVERSAINGVDVFRVFDAMNDMRNIEHALKAVQKVGKHAQGTLSYTVSPVHTLDKWVEMAQEIENMGAHSICVKDMAGLLKPYAGFELVTKLKQSVDIPIHMHCHATTGLSTATALKCIEAGADNIDTSISSMSMTYGHSATESLVAALADTEYDSGLELSKLETIAAYFREVRKKYRKFEGSLRGVDSRILVAQVPGGMLTNMESQLKDQNAEDKFDDVLAEIPRVREDLGFIPLVTPTSQIVGTQAVLNVLTGERYKNLSKEAAGILKGEYGLSPAPVNSELQARVLDGAEPITCRPADLLEPEMDQLKSELLKLADEQSIEICSGVREIDDVLTYALFNQIGLKFLKNRNNPDAFEPVPTGKDEVPTTANGEEIYTLTVDGKEYTVSVSDGGDITGLVPISGESGSANSNAVAPASPTSAAEPIKSPLSGNIFHIKVAAGQQVNEGDVLLVLEAMKMETNVTAARSGTVASIAVSVGDSVKVGDTLLNIA